ncbi:ROK family protein [Fredinandcohnia sp. 179-A 10B2 NHS]|uniref:ROK family transcriptional regulator n=1 Tax=Fredinandcohnia sp. 179-A 10B2 NHS TaxID=3235176 RepID=UPI0039A2AADA
MKIGHIELIKKINRELVLETIRNEQPISRAKISRNLGISRSTVSSIVDQLIEKKFVVEQGYGESTKEGGRRAIQLGFNPASAYGIGVEIKSEKVTVCIADLDGNVVFTKSVAHARELYDIRDAIQKCILESTISVEQIIAIGFCIPGITDSAEGIVIDSPELHWENIHLTKYMKDFFDKPIFINNNVNCLALGERWLGNAKNIDDFAYVLIEKGIGAAFMANGSLVQGKNFMAGEIGYFAFESDLQNMERNKLSEFGTFDKKASLLAFEKIPTPFNELIQNYQMLHGETRLLVDQFIQTLCLGLANIISLLNPEKLIIGGEAGRQLMLLKPVIIEQIKNITPIEFAIEKDSMKDNIGALGIMSFAFSQVKDTVI